MLVCDRCGGVDGIKPVRLCNKWESTSEKYDYKIRDSDLCVECRGEVSEFMMTKIVRKPKQEEVKKEQSKKKGTKILGVF